VRAYGALAPPVAPPALSDSLEAGFSVSAGAPPEEPDSPAPSLDEPPLDSEPEDSSPPEDEDSPVVVVLLVAVVEVEVVDRAAFSALVSAGGTMLGVLFGIDSETLLPPHA